jgi:predicted ATPase
LKTEWADRALATRATELESTIDLQQGLIEAISRHLGTMSEAGRELLTLAAVLGKEFQIAQLGIVSGLAPEDLMDRLDEAVRARLLFSIDGRYAFNHRLVRDVLYKRISSAERAARHRIVGEKLAAHYGEALDAHAPELADHFSRALPCGDPQRTIDLAIRAAAQRASAGLYGDAVRHWQQAARAYALLGAQNPRRVEVELGLARARLAAGQPSEARESFADAAVLARTFARPDLLAEAALGYASLATSEEVQRRALLEQALSAIADAPEATSRDLRGRIKTAMAGAPT